MKYKGKHLEGRNTDILVLNRGEDRIVIKAEALADFKEFNDLCPVPEPPIKIRPGGVKEADTVNPRYQEALSNWAEKKTNYTIIKSLEATKDLEWDTVKISNPDTYANWRVEMAESGFTEIEILRVLQLCTRVNSLDDDLLDQAKETFLAGARQQEE